MKRVFAIPTAVAVLLFGLLFAEIYLEWSQGIPPTAVVFINDQARTYLAPPCVQTWEGLRRGSVGEAWSLGYKPDPQCQDEGWFTQDKAGIVVSLLQKMGLINGEPTRWNQDGSWSSGRV